MNFYNEHDPKAAAWIRELIAAKLIPDGIVDERSILEIQPHELTRYTQCHFFAGIAGWSLALTLAGWPATRPVWTGSCPCQPFSNAGKGLAQADERHLWPVFFNLIRECRPEFVFGEQVASAIGKGWLDGVSADLESEGYACGAAVLGAHSLGAPHIRQRLFWVADAAGGQRQQRLRAQGHELQRPADDCADGRLADSILGRQCGRDERGLGAARQQVGEPENGARAANEPRDGREDVGGLAESDGRNAVAERLQRSGIDGLRTEDGCPDGEARDGEREGEWMGDAKGGGYGEQRNEAQQGSSGHVERTGGAGLGGLVLPDSAGPQPGRTAAAPAGYGGAAESTGGTSGMADTGYSESSRRELHTEGSDRGARDEPAPHGADGDGVADRERPRREGGERNGETGAQGAPIGHAGECGGDSGMAHSEQQGLEGQSGDGDDRDQPGRIGADEARPASASGGAWDSFDILPCRDGKARRVESGTFPLVDGIPGGVVPGSDPSVSEAQATAESRVMRLKGYGNAIVPAVAAEFLIAYLEIKSEP